MDAIGQALYYIGGIAGLICFILLLVRMFQEGESRLGTVCIVLAFCGGIGSLVAFVVGWVRAREWQVTQIMVVWSLCYILIIAGLIVSPVTP
jgi:hypothetical protein